MPISAAVKINSFIDSVFITVFLVLWWNPTKADKMPLTESEVNTQSPKKQGKRQAGLGTKDIVSVDRLQHNRGPSLVN